MGTVKNALCAPAESEHASSREGMQRGGKLRITNDDATWTTVIELKQRTFTGVEMAERE
jgi:hypothetical protein